MSSARRNTEYRTLVGSSCYHEILLTIAEKATGQKESREDVVEILAGTSAVLKDYEWRFNDGYDLPFATRNEGRFNFNEWNMKPLSEFIFAIGMGHFKLAHVPKL